MLLGIYLLLKILGRFTFLHQTNQKTALKQIATD